MTVKALAEALALRPLASPEDDREIVGAYVGDLLSWVMGRAKADNVWVTIMSNLNVIAVASLSGVSCVLFSEGVMPDADAIKRAELEEINLLVTNMTSYEACVAISRLI